MCICDRLAVVCTCDRLTVVVCICDRLTVVVCTCDKLTCCMYLRQVNCCVNIFLVTGQLLCVPVTG